MEGSIMGKRGQVSLGSKRTKGSAVVVSGTYFPVEPGMSDAEQRVWHATVKSMPVGYFTEADRAELFGLCKASAMLEKAAQELKANGEVYTDRYGNLKESPWVNIFHKAFAAVRSSKTKLRITKQALVSPQVAGRAAHDVAEAAKGGWKFEDLLFQPEQ